jgi:hypothetical protein
VIQRLYVHRTPIIETTLMTTFIRLRKAPFEPLVVGCAPAFSFVFFMISSTERLLAQVQAHASHHTLRHASVIMLRRRCCAEPRRRHRARQYPLPPKGSRSRHRQRCGRRCSCAPSSRRAECPSFACPCSILKRKLVKASIDSLMSEIVNLRGERRCRTGSWAHRHPCVVWQTQRPSQAP